MSWNSWYLFGIFKVFAWMKFTAFSQTFHQVFRWHLLTAFSLIISRQIFTVFSLFIFTVYRDFPVKTLVKVTKHFTKIFRSLFMTPFASSEIWKYKNKLNCERRVNSSWSKDDGTQLVPKFVRQSMSFYHVYTDPMDALKIEIIVSSIEAESLI